MDLEWDPDKADTNIAKHGVSFFDATEVFGDVLSSTFLDPDTSVGEDRYLIFGQNYRGTHLACRSRTGVIHPIDLGTADDSSREGGV